MTDARHSSFVSASEAAKDKLAFVNSAGNAIMQVDNFTNVDFNTKRNSIRITSDAQYTIGSLWIADILHVPYGVSRFGPRRQRALTPALASSARCGRRGGRRLPTGPTAVKLVRGAPLFNAREEAPELTPLRQTRSRVSIRSR